MIVYEDGSLLLSIAFFPRLSEHAVAVQFAYSVNRIVRVLADRVLVLVLPLVVLDKVLLALHSDDAPPPRYISIEHIRFYPRHGSGFQIGARFEMRFLTECGNGADFGSRMK